MSSVNPHFTFQYSQPSEYRFSHDSVFLARQVFELLKDEETQNWRGLDLCAGSGIVGLDFLFHFLNEMNKSFLHFDFLEVQEAYVEHFQRNQRQLPNNSTQIFWRHGNYQNFSDSLGYDVILCNPPYFRLGQGKLSPSDFKNRCRFFIDSDYVQLLKCIQRTLKTNGKAFVLLNDLRDHGWEPFQEAQKLFSEVFNIDKVASIRGTDLICFEKI